MLIRYINIIVKKTNIKYDNLVKSQNKTKLNYHEIELLDKVYLKYCIQDRDVFK